MSDEITIGDSPANPDAGKLVPMQVGNATVYIRATAAPLAVEPGDQIYAVALPSPQEAFESALGVIKECVGVIGAQIEQLGEKLRPQELSVEFSLQLECAGKANIIPVLLTTETKAGAALKVAAKWTKPQKEP